MAFLPDNRLEPALPFSYSAIDFFGPFIIKERRSDVKCYGVLFTCMGSRSVQLETANSLDRSSFINALMGAQNKLKKAMSEMDQDLVHEYFLRNGCQWIPFKMNVPIPVIWEVAGNGWSAVYTMRWNHYCQRPGANSMMRLCVHS